MTEASDRDDVSRDDGEPSTLSARSLVKNDRAALRVVTVGRDNGLTAEIRQGLREGEAIIVHPNERVEDGARVTVRGV